MALASCSLVCNASHVLASGSKQLILPLLTSRHAGSRPEVSLVHWFNDAVGKAAQAGTEFQALCSAVAELEDSLTGRHGLLSLQASMTVQPALDCAKHASLSQSALHLHLSINHSV